ncbi:MAG TPA: hypothetical protein ENJ12_00950, partial [Thiolapillus brandeum]|nr:hypothetical protein [Thiolapillus brandeum]
MHIPKTGGQSMLPVWYRHRIPVIGHDIRQPDYVSLARYKADMDPDCFAFAFVRNPWDRLVSTFFYLKKGGDNEDDRKDAEKYLPYEDFRTFVLEAFRGREIFEQLHLRPQYTWLSDGDRLVVDSVGRFEDLQAH